MKVLVELGEDGKVIRIFRHRKDALLSRAAEYGRVEEREKKDAVGEIRWQVFVRAEYECERCGALLTWRTLHLHEQLERGRGGEVALDNCQALCSRCHIGKDGAHRNRNLRFGEGQMLPRCPHSVYSPTGDGEPSVYCSGCYSPQSPAVPKLVDDGDEFEPQVEICPACEADIIVGDEFDIKCEACGFEN